MKMLIGVMGVIFCTIIGKILSEKYIKRKNFYCDFYNFNQKMKSEITFKQSSIKSIIEKLNNQTFRAYLNQTVIMGDDDLSVSFLNNEENDFLKEYVNNIGIFDKDSQLLYLNSVDSQIKTLYKNSFDEEKKYRKLYVKLGFLFGLIFLVIVL